MKEPMRDADMLSAIVASQASIEKHLVAIKSALQRQSIMLADQAALAGEHSAILGAIEQRLGAPPE